MLSTMFTGSFYGTSYFSTARQNRDKGENVAVLYFKVLDNKDCCTVLWIKSRIVTADLTSLQGDE